MEKDIAIALLSATVSLDEKLGEMDLVVTRITDVETKRKYVTALGNIIGGITFDIISPIVSEYPDLDPYRE
jgi:hypothetical protein